MTKCRAVLATVGKGAFGLGGRDGALIGTPTVARPPFFLCLPCQEAMHDGCQRSFCECPCQKEGGRVA